MLSVPDVMGEKPTDGLQMLANSMATSKMTTPLVDKVGLRGCLESSPLLLMASAIAFSSAITNIAVNQQKNVIQHPYI